jgi:hypothetical protein
LLDFDHAVLDFWEWSQARQGEEKRIRVKQPPEPGKGQMWSSERKYASMGDIFALYYRDRSDGIDPDVAAIDISELMDDFRTFDMTEFGDGEDDD